MFNELLKLICADVDVECTSRHAVIGNTSCNKDSDSIPCRAKHTERGYKMLQSIQLMQYALLQTPNINHHSSVHGIAKHCIPTRCTTCFVLATLHCVLPECAPAVPARCQTSCLGAHSMDLIHVTAIAAACSNPALLHCVLLDPARATAMSEIICSVLLTN